jgi:hypothetical protein
MRWRSPQRSSHTAFAEPKAYHPSLCFEGAPDIRDLPLRLYSVRRRLGFGERPRNDPKVNGEAPLPQILCGDVILCRLGITLCSLNF